MPAKSKSQQRFFGMVRSAQKGEMENPSNSIKSAAETMKPEDVEDYASTKHKDLPEKVKKEIVEHIVFKNINRYNQVVKENKTLEGTGRALAAAYKYFLASAEISALKSETRQVTTFGKTVTINPNATRIGMLELHRRGLKIQLDQNMPHLAKFATVSAITILTLAIINHIYKKYKDRSEGVCKNHPDRKKCITLNKIDAYKSAIKELDNLIPECNKLKDENKISKCQQKIQKRKNELQEKIQNLIGKL